MCIGGGQGLAAVFERVGMTRLAQTAGLTEVQAEIVATVRQFVDKEVIPNAQALEHADEYPQRDRRRDARDGAVRADDPARSTAGWGSRC